MPLLLKAGGRQPAWNNTHVLKGDTAQEVAKLRQSLKGDLTVHGSARLAQTLIEHDLVDELRLMVFPVLLGAGKRLFADSRSASALRLVDARPAGETVILT